MKNSKYIKVLLISVVAVFVVGVGIYSFTGSSSRGKKDGDLSSDKIVNDGESDMSADQSTNDQDGSGLNSSDTTKDLPNGSEWKNRLKGDPGSNNGLNGGDDNNGSNNISISFPYAVPNSNLVVKNIAGYGGIYLEDGSDVDVSNCAAILVENTGSDDIQYFNISTAGNSGSYSFTGTSLPAGQQMVVLADDRKGYNGNDFEQIGATTTNGTSFDLSKNLVEVTPAEDGGLTVKNISKSPIPMVRVFYKFYLNDQNAYVGGITYTAVVEDLAAGESKTVTPSHYEKDSSKIVMINVYDEKN